MTHTDVRVSVCLSFILLVLGMSACNEASAPPSQLSNSPRSQPAAVESATVAGVSSTVSFYGVPPQPVKIDTSNDPACRGGNQSEQVVTDDGRPANVLIYVKDGLGTRAFDPPKQALVVKQQGGGYTPYVGSVIGNPYFIVMGEDGKFRLSGLPPGTYTIAAVHEKVRRTR